MSYGAKTKTAGASEDKYVYNTLRPTRGKALVFNIREFNLPSQPPMNDSRKFTDVDLSTIITPLKNLGFDVRIVMHEPGQPRNRKVTYRTVMTNIHEAAKDDHSESDCFLCIFLSFGYHGQVFASDYVVPIELLQQPFKGTHCPTLVGKPKIFILQTCMKELPHATHDSDGYMSKVGTIPAEADFFVFWSHIDNTRYPFKKDVQDKGTIFIQLLAQHLRAHLKCVSREGEIKEDFLHFCIRLTGEVEKHLQENYKGCLESNPKLLPYFTSMLTKDLYLGPKDCN